MKTQPKKEHASTIPLWVRRRTGDGRMDGFKPLTEADFFEKLMLATAIIITLRALLSILGNHFMAPVPDWWPLLVGAISVSFTAIFIASWWGRRKRAMRWLEEEWRRATGVRGLPKNLQTALYELEHLTARPHDFHSARDIAAWLGHCERTLRPHQVVGFTERYRRLLNPEA